MPSVLIADRHRLHADALARALGSVDDVTAMSVRPGETVLDAVARWRPEVVIIGEQPDLRRRWAEMLDVWPPVRVVQLVDTAGSDLVRAARDAGCVGVVERSGDLIELASAIEQVAEDGLVFPKTTRQKTETPFVNPLSERELEVLTLIDGGHTTKAIARELALSPHTVRNHVQRLLEKLDAHSRMEALAIARRHDLLPTVAA